MGEVGHDGVGDGEEGGAAGALGFVEGRAVWRDFLDACAVQVRAGDGLFRVTVPADALQAYTIVYLR